MKTWPVQDAKARFSTLLDLCLLEGPQMITKQGAESAVLVPAQEWHPLQQAARPTLKAILLKPLPRGEFFVAKRGRFKPRSPEA